MTDSPTYSPNQPDGSPVWQNPRFIAAAIGAVVFVVFAIQNAGSVDVEFLFWGFEMRLIVLMILCAIIGAAVWELIKYLRRRQRA